MKQTIRVKMKQRLLLFDDEHEAASHFFGVKNRVLINWVGTTKQTRKIFSEILEDAGINQQPTKS